jgi:SAM-dependent methyltransferase
VTRDVSGYVHGYTPTEQERLVSQSRFLAPWVMSKIDYRSARSVLEVGCGVGAQMALLLERFPQLTVTGIDREAAQIAKAEQVLAPHVKTGRANLVLGRGETLPFGAGAFDGGFLCWVLEHVAEPAALLGEIRRVLAPGAPLFVTEVYCGSLETHPRLPNLRTFWRAMCDYQAELGGDPNVGIRLSGLLRRAGFAEVETYPVLFEVPDGARHEYLEYWRELMHSAAPGLVSAQKIPATLPAALDADFAALRAAADGALTCVAMQARARVR